MSYNLDVGLTLLFAIAAPSAHANDAMTVFGHPVELVGTLNDQKLTVDGKVLVKDAIVSIEQINVVAGTGVLIGGSSGGGNACDIAPFVVSFPPGEQAKVDGPINECGMGNIIFHPGSIEFVYSALPNLPGHRWIWTAAGGFKDAGDIAFGANGKLGWDALRHHDLAFPIDLYKNSEVGAAIKALTGTDDEAFTTGLTGPSDGEFDGDTYIGSGCVAHGCPFAGSFVIADIANRKIYLAWKEDGRPFVVRPSVKQWPGPFRFRLKEWTEKFAK